MDKIIYTFESEINKLADIDGEFADISFDVKEERGKVLIKGTLNGRS